MAEQPMSIEMVEVKAADIMNERQSMYDGFMTASKWGIGATIILLVAIYLFFG